METKKCINILCIVIWLLSFGLDITTLGYSCDTGIINRITYMFAHTSCIHLAVNLLVFNAFYKSISGFAIKSGIMVAFISAFLATFFSTYDVPTIGLSGVCFAMAGVVTTRMYKNKNYMLSIGLVLVLQVVLYFFSSYNVLNHISSFIIAILITIIIDIYGKVKRKIEKLEREISQRQTEGRTY